MRDLIPKIWCFFVGNNQSSYTIRTELKEIDDNQKEWLNILNKHPKIPLVCFDLSSTEDYLKIEENLTTKDNNEKGIIDMSQPFLAAFYLYCFYTGSYNHLHDKEKLKNFVTNNFMYFYDYYDLYLNNENKEIFNNNKLRGVLDIIYEYIFNVNSPSWNLNNISVDTKELICKFMLKFLTYYQETPNFQKNFQTIKDKVLELVKIAKPNNEIKSKYDSILKRIYLKCYENGQSDKFFDDLLNNAQKSTIQNILRQVEKIKCEIDKDEIKAFIYFNNIKNIESMNNIILNISIGYISQEVFSKKRKDENINKYCNLFNAISDKKITNIIFQCKNEQELQEIKQFLSYDNMEDFTTLSEEEKERGKGIYYVLNKKISLFYPQYRLNLSKTPLELFKIIKFVRNQEGNNNNYSDITYKFIDDSSSTYFIELLKKCVVGKDINVITDLKDIIIENLLKYKNDFHNALISSNEKNIVLKCKEVIENNIKQFINILEQNGIVEYFKPISLFKQNLKKDISIIEQKPINENKGDKETIQMRIAQKIKQIDVDFKENNNNQKKKTSNDILPSFVEEMKEEFPYFIELLFSDQSKEMKKLFYLSYDYFLKNKNLSNKINTKRQKLCFFYVFIKSNQTKFELLEKLMFYIGVFPDTLYSIYQEKKKDFAPKKDDNDDENKEFLEFSLSMNEFNRNYFWLIFNCLIEKYTYESVLNNLSNFNRVISIINNIVYQLDIFSKEQIILQCYFSLISNLSKINFNKEITKKLLIKINTSFTQKTFSLQKEITAWEQINKNEDNKKEDVNDTANDIENQNNKDEDNKVSKKEIFTNFNKFIIQYLRAIFKLYPEDEKLHEQIIDLILSNDDYIKQSKPFFRTLLSQTIFDFNNEIDKSEGLSMIINHEPILKFLSKKLKNKKNEILEQKIMNIFENIILNEINQVNQEELKSPLYINYYSISVKELSNEPKNEIVKLQLIAFLKVYLFSIFKQIDSENSIDYADFFNVFNKEKGELAKVLKIYFFKNVRAKDEHNYEKFKHYDYLKHQLFFAKDFSFKENYPSNFEYLFLSECKEGNKAFEDKYIKNKKLFLDYQQEQFRTNVEKEYIINELTSNNCDIFMDNMFNLIFSQLKSKKYREESSEFNNFTNWIDSVRKDISIKNKKDNKLLSYYEKTIFKISDLMNSINDDLYKVEIILICLKMTLLFFFLKAQFKFDFTVDKGQKELLNNFYEAFLHLSNSDIVDDNYHYLLSNKEEKWYYSSMNNLNLVSKFENKIKQEKNNKNENEKIKNIKPFEKEKIESISKCISSKKGNFVKNIKNFELINYNGYIYNDEELLMCQLSMNLFIFMTNSYNYYNENKTIEGINYPDIFYTIYDTISKQLRLLNLTNSKLFMNVFYVEMKNYFLQYEKETLDHYELYQKITEIIKNYTENEKDYVSYIKDKMDYNDKNELEMRNLTLDKRIDINTIKLTDYPFFNYFYYAKYPSIEDFTEQFNKIYHKEKKYPITNEIINNKLDIFQKINQDKMNQLIKIVLNQANDLSQLDIMQLISSKNKTNFAQNEVVYQYIGKYDSFNSIIVDNSYRNNIYKNKMVYCNGDIIEYDYNAIEKEVSTIFLNASYIQN